MTKHLFKVSGLDAQGKPFMGSCVAWDIIDAINMFREKHYSPHEITQGVQMPAEHPCCIVCLQGAEESFVIAQSGVDKNLRDLQLCEYLKSEYELTDKDRFCELLRACGIEFECSEDGIELEVCALEGDGYLFIKFYEDGKFQEFVHYPD